MKQKFLFAIASMLLFCTLAFTQTDGISAGLISGVYFIRIYQNGEFLNTQKVIIE